MHAPSRPPEASGKIVPLEALRGMAAIGVVFHHFALGFLPQLINLAPPGRTEGALVGSPLFLLVNGKAMVITFFVLSGYVLSLKGLRAHAGQLIAEAAFKRWFRFAPVICISVFCSYILFALHLYHYDDVFALNGARMFNHYAGIPQDYQPGFLDVASEGLWGSLILGRDRYNTVLWSMQTEFFGSMVVFALALLLTPGRRWWFLPALALVALLFFEGAIWFFPFLFGVLGVYLKLDKVALGKGTTVLLLVLGLYLCGYYGPVGWYFWLSGAYAVLQDIVLRVAVSTLGGFLLLVVFATQNPVSAGFTGPLSRMLGSISFSLYLLHTLILASFCAWAYVRMGGAAPGVLAAAATFMITAPLFVFMLARFDRWWLMALGRWHPFAARKKSDEGG